MKTYKRRKSNQHVYNQWLGELGSKRNPIKVSPKLFRIIENGRWYSQMLSDIFKKLKNRPADYWEKENQRKLELYKTQAKVSVTPF